MGALTAASGILVWAPMVGCANPVATPARSSSRMAVAESTFADLREIHDRWEVTVDAGVATSPDGTPLSALRRRYNELRTSLNRQLGGVDSSTLTAENARALGVMRRTLERDLEPIAEPTATAGGLAAPACAFDAAAIAKGPDGLDSLRRKTYDCYGWAQHQVVVGTDTMDRLSILGAVTRSDEAARRRRLFLALEPVWRTMNGGGGPASPYRQLIALEVKSRGAGGSPAADQARASGVYPDSLERWLLAILEAWRDRMPDSLLEPWDWYYEAGRASRALSPRVPSERLQQITAEVFKSVGADIAELGIRYDLAPRDRKTPVAFTTFGQRGRYRKGRWTRGEPWVFATYRSGGLDNLNELLHETGHAVHLSAIRTRPAYNDWPDSDPFTEALGDFIALDVYEPLWQQRWLGDSVPLADGLRARYAGIVLDVAWALLEARMLRDPSADPNQVWAALTREYLRIRPHPELAWWAMRGQLVDAPGYMMNYAAGAILIAAIRARTVELHGSFTAGDSTWYGWVAPRLYRFGLERPSREVVKEFLGGPVSPAAILRDMGRMKR